MLHCNFECNCSFDEHTVARLSKQMQQTGSETEVLAIIAKANQISEGKGCCIQILRHIPRELI